jgi:hypothetical protein
MLVPDPPNCPSGIVLIAGKPELALLADDVEDIPGGVGKIRISALSTRVDVKVVNTRCAEQRSRAYGRGAAFKVPIHDSITWHIRHGHGGREESRVSISRGGWRIARVRGAVDHILKERRVKAESWQTWERLDVTRPRRGRRADGLLQQLIGGVWDDSARHNGISPVTAAAARVAFHLGRLE